ncbi:hypothetical protein Pen02_80500 [Plantactinospora endophytica]|uniref:Uncharacterized protein n=1 Tax=Plantactinospora endophytica TaxID=673535 RepID=A0ABQ4EEG1_9ACTN|nr:hypothetical protein Pen02_80500 [Plantactinospora endophytica]
MDSSTEVFVIHRNLLLTVLSELLGGAASTEDEALACEIHEGEETSKLLRQSGSTRDRSIDRNGKS